MVRQAVARLPTRQREAVVLRHFLDLSVEAAAEVMGVSSGALRSLTHRATGQLEQMLTMTEEDAGTHV
ncbi:MAG: sigma factor-like helix-turn-helix DNA-binding protein [Acidimicrobiia bacterium]